MRILPAVTPTSLGRCPTASLHRKNFPSLYAEELNKQTVAQWVGVSTHALVSGMDMPEPDKIVTYDKLTPTYGAAKQQSMTLAKAINKRLMFHGATVIGREVGFDGEMTIPRGNRDIGVRVRGVIDLVIEYNNTLMVVDIKTGNNVAHNQWYQLGLYALAANDLKLFDSEVCHVGVILCPRRKSSRSMADVADSRFVVDEYREVSESCEELHEEIIVQREGLRGAKLTRTGLGCRRCKADCGVRTYDYEG